MIIVNITIDVDGCVAMLNSMVMAVLKWWWHSIIWWLIETQRQWWCYAQIIWCKVEADAMVLLWISQTWKCFDASLLIDHVEVLNVLAIDDYAHTARRLLICEYDLCYILLGGGYANRKSAVG